MKDRTATKQEDGSHLAKEHRTHRADERLTEQNKIAPTEWKKVAHPNDKKKREELMEPWRRSTNKMLTELKKGSAAQGNHQSKDSKCTLSVKVLHNVKCNNQLMMLVKDVAPWQRSLETEFNRSSITHNDNSTGV